MEKQWWICSWSYISKACSKSMSYIYEDGLLVIIIPLDSVTSVKYTINNDFLCFQIVIINILHI